MGDQKGLLRQQLYGRRDLPTHHMRPAGHQVIQSLVFRPLPIWATIAGLPAAINHRRRQFHLH